MKDKPELVKAALVAALRPVKDRVGNSTTGAENTGPSIEDELRARHNYGV